MVVDPLTIDNGNKYIHFILRQDTGKTQQWRVENKSSGYTLAIIKWYGAWRQYVIVFDQPFETTFNDGCLKSVIDFLGRLNKEKRIL